MFAKRGIAFKLGLGFALLIIFTVAVASVGYLGLSDLLTRSAKMDAVGDISDAITNARMHEVDPTIAVYVEETRELLGELERGLLELEANPEDAERVDACFRAMEKAFAASTALASLATAVRAVPKSFHSVTRQKPRKKA